ncbi:hypothetical protein CSKR_110146 [Clonorchis sinensis]|uniref:Uncharacterized protein n=1 Tax=Clonorchis sinensis TaxID=79923 RepID=A0A419Q039_CLOSI|nr:hypothetical protein CSKR_110146 [Clonorchis sinensis]
MGLRVYEVISRHLRVITFWRLIHPFGAQLSCHQEDSARLPKPRQGNSGDRFRVRTTDLPVTITRARIPRRSDAADQPLPPLHTRVNRSDTKRFTSNRRYFNCPLRILCPTTCCFVSLRKPTKSVSLFS